MNSIAAPSNRSLASRLFFASLALLPVILIGIGLILDRAHSDALRAASSERLHLQLVALIAQADFASELTLPATPMETRLLQADSGLYALVTDTLGDVVWRSPSTALLDNPIAQLTLDLPTLAAGASFTDESGGLVRHAYQVVWEFDDQHSEALRFVVAESSDIRDVQLHQYRRSLLLALLLTLVTLLALQLGVLRWGLRPLQVLSSRIQRLEAGEAVSLEGDWPNELTPLANNLNHLIAGEAKRRERLRNSLSDLAHSLKTPLAVLRTADAGQSDYATLREEQLTQMTEVIEWHLQRAAGSQGSALTRSTLAPIVNRLGATLRKVYADRGLELSIRVDSGVRVRGDERDLMELIGNVLDNACKYCRQQVAVNAEQTSRDAIALIIEDDGVGISPDLRDILMHRGMRADHRQPGQGIGLSIVHDVATSLGGDINIATSGLGGARVTLILPM